MGRYDQFTDEELIEKYKSGDNEACDEIIVRYKQAVRSATRNLFLVGGDEDDILQEGTIGLFKAIRDFDPDKEASFSTFASLCIRRCIYKAIEASNCLKNVPLNEAVSIFDENGNEDSDNLDQALWDVKRDPQNLIVESEYLKHRKEELYSKLSKLEKQVFDLYMEGFDYREISLRLEKEEKAIDNCLQRIKAKAK